MGGVSTDSGGKGGRKSVDSNVNMVPMIDLLISVIAFLLMTAVWVQTGALQASQPRGPSNSPETNTNPTEQLKVVIAATGVQVGTNPGNMTTIENGPQKMDRLRQELRTWHTSHQQEREVTLQPESTIAYNDIIEVMDAIYEVWGTGRPPGTAIRDLVTVRFM